MRRAVGLGALLFVLSARVTSAAGLDLAWTECLADGGVPCRAFACDRDVGNHVLDGSFVLDTPMQAVIGVEIVVQIQFAGGVVPEWWMFRNPGSCRLNSSSITNSSSPNFVCLDWSEGQAFIAIAAYQPDRPVPGLARFLCVAAMPQGSLANLVPGQQYNAFRLFIYNHHTVSTPCAGCLTGATLEFRSLNITTAGNVDNRFLSGGQGPYSNLAGWQGNSILGCPPPVPTRNVTWGRVKSMYR